MTLVSAIVVTQRGGPLLGACLAALRAAVSPLDAEILVVDNSIEGVAAPGVRVLPQGRNVGFAGGVVAGIEAAAGEWILLVNDDAELEPGATTALHEALSSRPEAAIAGAMLVTHAGRQEPSAWRFPGPLTALLTVFQLHRRFVVQSRGTSTRQVDWVQSAALLVRRDAAEAVGYIDPAFFVFSDEVDFCKRLHDAGWEVLHVPSARAVGHEPPAYDERRRIVELSRNRDRYMRKHHGPSAARSVRWLTAFTYAMRALAALVLPGHDARLYARHASATLFPGRGEGLAESAAEYNRGGRRL